MVHEIGANCTDIARLLLRGGEALEKLPQLYLQRSPINQRQISTIN